MAAERCDRQKDDRQPFIRHSTGCHHGNTGRTLEQLSDPPLRGVRERDWLDARITLEEGPGQRPRARSALDRVRIGEGFEVLPLQLVEHAVESLARAGGLTLHVRGSGRNDHHLAEAAFKALGRALREACEADPRRGATPASTKGALG